MNIINLTPHPLNIQRADGTMCEVAPYGTVARCAETRAERPALEGIGVTMAQFGAVEGLPEAREGIIYVVSALVLAQVPHRPDVFAPGPALRDEQGRITGCVGLSCTPAYNPGALNSPVLAVEADVVLHEAKSTNGRWGFSLVGLASTRTHDASPVYAAKVASRRDDGSQTIIRVQPDAEARLCFGSAELGRIVNANKIISMGLQSGGYAYVLELQPGAIWEEIGYKGRSRKWMRLNDTRDRVTTASALEVDAALQALSDK